MSDHPLSFSQIKTFKRCPWLYNQSYNEGIRRATTGLKLATGDFIHRLLADMTRSNDWRVTWATIKHEYEDAQLFEEEAEAVAGIADRVFKIIERYERLVWEPIFSKWTVLHVEEELSVPFEFPIVIKPDLVAADPQGSVWVIDRKSLLDFEADLEENLRYDDQVSLYMLGLIRRGLNVVGAMHDMIRTRLPRFPGITKKGLIDRRACVTDEETIRAGITEAINAGHPTPAALLSDAAAYLQDMKPHEFFKQVPTFRSDLMLEKLAEEYRLTKWMIDAHTQIKAWPRTFIPRDCPRCPLRELCMADLQGGDVDALMQTTYRRRGEDARPHEVPAEMIEEVA